MYVRKRTAGEADAHIEVWTPAKLNLTLDILERREDGFHEIETVMTAVSIFDTLQIRTNPAGDVRLELFDAGGCVEGDVIPTDKSNLVIKALDLLKNRTGCEQGANVALFKRIPSAAGMGGGSSDAAAALFAGNKIWKLGQSQESLCTMASELGSDVPFFLGPSPAICRGRGEKIVATRNLGRMEFVIVRPPVGLSTAKVYSACTPQRPESPGEFGNGVADVPSASQIGSWLRNGLQDAARGLTPWIGRLQQIFDRMGLVTHQLTGSGSAYFGICHNAGQAIQVARRLQGMELGLVYRASSLRGSLSA